MNDLKTTEGILEWVGNTTIGRRPFEPEKFKIKRIAEYTETAARLALAMRVLEVVERERGSMFDADRIVCTAVLDEAKKGDKQ